MNRICIIGGAGHIGFPMGLFLASKKNNVYLYDINKKYCEIINSNKSPHYEENVDYYIKKYRKNYLAGNDPKKISDSKVIIICLGTPVNNDSSPKIKDFLNTIRKIKPYLNKDQLIIIRSSVYPGTIDKIKNILKKKIKKLLIVLREYYKDLL